MPDRSFLNWPFFYDSHRDLAGNLENWADEVLEPLAADEHSAERGRGETGDTHDGPPGSDGSRPRRWLTPH